MTPEHRLLMDTYHTQIHGAVCLRYGVVIEGSESHVQIAFLQ